MDVDAKHSAPIPNPSMEERQQDEPCQYSVAERGTRGSASVYPREPEQHLENGRTQLKTSSWTREQKLEHYLTRAEVKLEQKDRQLDQLKINGDASTAAIDHQSCDVQEELQTKLTTKEEELRDLTGKLTQKGQEIDNIRRLWKGAARELGKRQARGKVIDQVTDSDLIQKAGQLQYNVRDFTRQHFGDEVNTGEAAQDSWQHWQKKLKVSSDFLDACIHSPVKRPMLVEALLWDSLVKDILGKFWWGGGEVHYGMEILTNKLKSERSCVVCSLTDSNDFIRATGKRDYG